jgi:gluconate 2-dehydrogenase gamma chain
MDDDTSSDGPTRRFVLATAAAPLAAVWLPACDRSSHTSRPRDRREPVFLSASEWSFLEAWVDVLIPADGTGPGAVEAGVVGFIDRQLAGPYGRGDYWYMAEPFHPEAPATLGYQHPYTPSGLYRWAIAALDQHCLRTKGQPLADCSLADRHALVEATEKQEISGDAKTLGAFFELALRNTREGYFSDPIHGGNRNMLAWRMIGFPGARADFTDWMDQPGKRYPLGPVSVDGRT